jgi:hypothetical protein
MRMTSNTANVIDQTSGYRSQVEVRQRRGPTGLAGASDHPTRQLHGLGGSPGAMQLRGELTVDEVGLTSPHLVRSAP